MFIYVAYPNNDISQNTIEIKSLTAVITNKLREKKVIFQLNEPHTAN